MKLLPYRRPSSVYRHLVWPTLDDAPLLEGAVASFVSRRMRTVASQLGLRAVAVGPALTHCHALLRWDTDLDVHEVVCELKICTSVEWNHRVRLGFPGDFLHWGDTSHVQTVPPEEWLLLADYLDRHVEHHRLDTPLWARYEPEWATRSGATSVRHPDRQRR
jgi:hypothetical protein